MARVERIIATGEIPVQQAQLASAGPADTSSAEALKAAAGAVNVLAELAKRKRAAQDRIGIIDIDAIMDNAKREYDRQIIGKPLSEHAAIQAKLDADARAKANQINLSPEARKLTNATTDAELEKFADEAELANIVATNEVALIKATDAYVKALTEGDSEDIIQKEGLLDAQLENIPAAEAAKYKSKLDQQAFQAMEDRAISDVHEALEENNFGIARELAKNDLIPEPKQTILRNAIKTAEKALDTQAKDARKELIDKTTSDTIREYFAGDMTVATLNKRHEKGLLKDADFKEMMEGITKTIPEHSNLIAAGKIRRAKADFDMGAITRSEANSVVLRNYTKLDGEDREKVMADLEDIEAKIIATAKSNAYNEGSGLMSRRFVGIQTEEDLIDLFRGAGLSEDEKKRINRRFTAEVNNRDLYERAVTDRFKEMRQEGISDSNKYRAESLSILLQYQRRKQLTLEELETAISKEQKEIISGIKKPKTTIKPISEMTTEEKQRELERIRELKRLAR